MRAAKKFSFFNYVTAFVALAALTAGLFPVQASTAIMTSIAVTPANSGTSIATNITVVFTPVTATTTGSVIVYTYDAAFSGGAALTDNDIAISGTNITSKACIDFAAGYFKCTLVSSATVSGDITTVIGGTNKLTTPATPGNYTFSLSVQIGGAGENFDTGAGLAYIAGENQAVITANVPPLLTFDIYNTGTATLMTLPYSCDLGEVTQYAVSSCDYDLGVGTNSPGGAGVEITGSGPMTDGSDNVIDAVGTPLAAGHEGYGFYISNSGSKFSAAGYFATPVQAIPTTTTTIATSTTLSDKTTITDHITVQHTIAISGITAPGVYTQSNRYSIFTN